MNRSEHIHFIGIGGYGMSAIARVMLEMGYRVSGSDVTRQELTDKLAAKGAQIYIGHQAEHVEGADIVVYSTALAKDNVELAAARQSGIPVLHRAEMLARIMNAKKGIAVAGAHGKTTTSSMIAFVMERCQMDPTYIIGGEIVNVGSNAKAGLGEFVVAEADESDGSFLKYFPTLALVNNVEADHLENYDGEFAKLQQAYATFLNQVQPGGKAIICKDDIHLREMMPAIRSEVIAYGIDTDAEFTARRIVLEDRKITFDVYREEEALGRMTLPLAGKHNVYNALATCITCLEAGLSFAQIAEAMKDFHGAKRRFQVQGDVDGILVIDDYAHHPTEIQATILAAKATGKRIIAVFQPQRYTRTFFLLDQFSRSFGEANEVIISDIYSPAGEKKIEGINSAKLAELIRQHSNENVKYIPSREDVQQYLLEHVRSGDVVLTMGAGDIWKTAEGLARSLDSKHSGKSLI